MAALSPRTGPRPIPDIMRELKDATGVDASKITEAANAVCEELGVDTSGTLKDKVHRAAAVPGAREDARAAADGGFGGGVVKQRKGAGQGDGSDAGAQARVCGGGPREVKAA